jgi:hypothetical protein
VKVTGVKYKLPEFLNGKCTPQAYRQWLSRKAKTHVKRDRARGNVTATVEEYKQAIHQAVLLSGDRDAYTGQPLQWKLISQYNNADSKKGRCIYKKDFADLPTVDHVGNGSGPANFVICSWRVNDAKNDLDRAEFLELCRAVLAHCEPNQIVNLIPCASGSWSE